MTTSDQNQNRKIGKNAFSVIASAEKKSHGRVRVSTAASSDGRGASSRRARRYTGTAASEISNALITFTAAYASGTLPKSAYAGEISTG